MSNRQWILAVADELIDGAQAASTSSGAQFDGVSDRIIGLEGFARSFLLAALRIRGTHGQPEAWCDYYRCALSAGMTPGHPDEWPPLGDHGQAAVEATVVAVGLHLTEPWIWQKLSAIARERLLDWLSGDHWCADNNHVLFGALCHAFCYRHGRKSDLNTVWAALDRIEEWYVGDGWYTDGDGRRFDHYNAWTFHLYPFWILDLIDPTGEETTTRRELYRRRLRSFCEGYRRLFASDGSFVAMGRSLIYRFGVLAPFWMAELEGCSPLAPGETGALTRRTVEHFLERGAVRDGLLTLGWHGPNPSLLQSYSTTGSPLWAAKGLLGLLLPDAHRAWAHPRKRQSEDSAPFIHPGPQWLSWSHPEDGIVRLLNMGSDGHPQANDPLYRRSLYSSATLPSFEPGWADQTVGPLHGRHVGRLSGVVRPDSGAERTEWVAQGRQVVVDHAVVERDGVEVHVARCEGVVGLTLAIGGWNCPEGLESILEVVSHDGQHVDIETCSNNNGTLQRALIIPEGNRLHVSWITAIGAAAKDVPELEANLRVEWLENGASVSGRDWSRPAAFITGRRLWRETSTSQHAYRWH